MKAQKLENFDQLLIAQKIYSKALWGVIVPQFSNLHIILTIKATNKIDYEVIKSMDTEAFNITLQIKQTAVAAHIILLISYNVRESAKQWVRNSFVGLYEGDVITIPIILDFKTKEFLRSISKTLGNRIFSSYLKKIISKHLGYEGI